MNKSFNVQFMTERELVVRALIAGRLHSLAVKHADAKATARCDTGWQECLAEIAERNTKKAQASAQCMHWGMPEPIEGPNRPDSGAD